MTSETQLRAFIARHRILLNKERDEEVERSSLLLSKCGPKLLEQKGLALGALGIASLNVGKYCASRILFHADEPEHAIRPGDLARIEENVSETFGRKKSAVSKTKKPDDSAAARTQGLEGVVYKVVSDMRIVITLDVSETSTDGLDLPERCRVVKLANSVTFDRMDKALNILEKIVLPDSQPSSEDKFLPDLTQLTRVLMGMSEPSKRNFLQKIVFFDETLNSSQQDAVRFAMESPEIACIHGPPGTGKTHTLIEIIRQMTSVTSSNPKPLRLLICGASNLAVDNILERLLGLPSPSNGEKIKVTRVGHPARVMAHEGIIDSTLEVKASRSDQAALAKDVKNELTAALDTLSGKAKGVKGKAPRGAERKKLWEEVRALRKEQREGGVVETVLAESQVVLATCHSAGGRQLRNHKFDVIIIDEATQALEAVCWIPIFKGQKLILAGDPMQLPPTILSANDHKTLADTSTKKSPNSGRTPQSFRPNEKLTPKSKISATPPLTTDSSDATEDESSSVTDSSSEREDNTPKRPVKVLPRQPAQKEKANRRQGLRPPRTLETTLFDRLEKMYGPDIKRMLNIQYRMHAKIAEFPSKVMYHSKLVSHSSVASHLLRDLPNAGAGNEDDEQELLGTPVVFFDTAGCEYFERTDSEGDEGSKCNENESAVVKNYVDQLIGTGITPSQIAIITPYQAQVSLLTSLLRPIHGLDLEIGTVDGMQGREKDAVIITLVRSNEKREVGFLKDKRRLNGA
ncbi:uncharacterized protein FIBRA_01370 [Fibroporia radiculosa]|uniref:AAA+ ATPase domain-containing protein n=1 Tax=Fibroporia radiculosa TaxID=599839 RepID=J4HT80_9APHY|nr:uncharacterized protein FIBRA_01370 [Fibroporia radiculosa]CCL99352.1 predicted protein [Fibroporia radiculosa]